MVYNAYILDRVEVSKTRTLLEIDSGRKMWMIWSRISQFDVTSQRHVSKVLHAEKNAPTQTNY